VSFTRPSSTTTTLHIYFRGLLHCTPHRYSPWFASLTISVNCLLGCEWWVCELPSKILTRVRRNIVLFPGQILIVVVSIRQLAAETCTYCLWRVRRQRLLEGWWGCRCEWDGKAWKAKDSVVYSLTAFASGSRWVALSFYLSFLKTADNVPWFSLRG